MNDFKKSWTLEMAVAVLENTNVDAKTWSEAVEWLLLYGPPHIRELLGQASHSATSACFPELKPSGYTRDGQACYEIDAIAESLGLSREEAIEKMTELEQIHGFRHLYEDDETLKVQ
ncbi:MAG: hypothetical protein HY885_13775 [Deltaproteobacteria bacterium]|nr:hypothetical protein [Deltaproteobacteria bacterium]